MRRLRLLGPASVDQFPESQKNPADFVGNGRTQVEVPRFRSRITIALLGYLVVEQRSFGREHLASLLWPDETPSKGRGNLRRELHNLSRILPDCWETDRQMVAFIPSADTIVDLNVLLQLETQERWGEAAELLGGAFLEGLYLDQNLEFENWLLGEREQWRARSENVLRHVIDGHTRRGQYSEALIFAQRLLQLAPWDEAAHRQTMRLLAWTGQRGAAMRQFERSKQALRSELNIEPSDESIALYEQIEVGRLDLPPQLPAFLTEEKARRAYEEPLFVGREHELEKLGTYLNEALAGRSRVIFITGGPGRGKTALLEAFTQIALKANPKLLVASGKCHAFTGAGDPYLPYRDVMAMLTGDVEGRWDAGAITRDHSQRLWASFSFVVQRLLDIGPHLLDVFVSSTALLSRSEAALPDNPPWLSRLREHALRDWQRSKDLEQSHLFQQYTNTLLTITKSQPLLLVLDDFQWADSASINLLFHLGRCLADNDCRLLIACAYRPEEVEMGREGARHPLAKVLSEFKRDFGDVWVRLSRKNEAEERKFVGAILDAEPNRLTDEFRTSLYNRTRGHALFTVELLRSLQTRGDLIKEEGGTWIVGGSLDWEVLPARVEAVIKERIDRLNPDLQQILTIASIEGEVFTAKVVAEIHKMPERMLLSQLSQDLERRHRLVREQEEIETGQKRLSRYRFGHVLFQDYLYKRLSLGERRILHGEVAAAIEKQYDGQLDEMAVQLAHHFYQAGDQRSAFHFSLQAAQRAARLYESGDAIVHFTRAIQLAEMVSPDVAALAQLYRGRGLAHERLGEFEKARADHSVILGIARRSGEQQVEWRAYLDLGRLWTSRDYKQAREYFEAALELARHTGDPASLADSLNWMGNWHANDENPSRAVEHHQKALYIFKELGDRRELANSLDLLALTSLLGSDLNTRVRYYDQAITLYRELGDRSRLASSLTGRATIVSSLAWLASVPAIPAPDAVVDFEEALQIAREIDSAPNQAWAHYSLGMMHTVHGHFGKALQEIETGMQIASDTGHREYIVGSRYALGLLYLEMFALERANKQLEKALILARELSSTTWFHTISGTLAATYIAQGSLELAQATLDEVLSVETPMDTMAKRYCWIWQAELAFLQEQPERALEIVNRLIDSSHGMTSGQAITYLWKLKGEALAAAGHRDEACTLLNSAVESALEAGERFLLWRIHGALGRLLQKTGPQKDADGQFVAARALIDEMAATLRDEKLRDGFVKAASATLNLPA